MIRERLNLDGKLPVVEARAGDTLSALPDNDIEWAYRRFGALLFRGFALGLNEFRDFTLRFCKTLVYNDSPNRELLDAATSIQSVDRGSGAFPLHPELSREPWKPDVCFFLCMDAPRRGGQTTICDGVEIVARLPAEVKKEMANRRLVYIQQARPNVLEFWLCTPDPSDEELGNPPPDCPYDFQRVGDAVARIFSRPLLHKPMFSDHLAFGNYLLFAREQGENRFPILDDHSLVPNAWMRAVKRESDAITVRVDWRDGDLLMLDNTRFMHGRTQIQEVSERRIATAFGYLKFAVPNPDEPPDPIWRRSEFRPPQAVGAKINS